MARYNEAFKQLVVQEYLTESVGYGVLARKYSMDRALLRRWVSAYQHHGAAALRDKAGLGYSAEFKRS